jgi:ABC-type nitrate/sulfonate/bicarbonate transport system substrate-binding protein
MDIDRDIEVVILGEERQLAFAGNPIDALYAHTPFLEKALVEQGAVLLVNQSRGNIPELAGLAGHALVTTREFASAKPDVVLALTRGVYRAQQLIQSDLKASEDALFRFGVPGLQRQLVEALLPIYQAAIPRTPEVSIEAIIKTNKNFFPATQPPPDLSKVNLADYIAPQFARQAVTGPP